MSLPVPEISFNNVVKHPLTWTMILLSIAGGFMLDQFVIAKKDQNNDCKQEVIYWKNSFATERNINLQITNELLDQKLGYTRYKDSTQKTDSLVRKHLLIKSKKLINH
jgi:hypothetical protein